MQTVCTALDTKAKTNVMNNRVNEPLQCQHTMELSKCTITLPAYHGVKISAAYYHVGIYREAFED